jgi:hypothetical protein
MSEHRCHADKKPCTNDPCLYRHFELMTVEEIISSGRDLELVEIRSAGRWFGFLTVSLIGNHPYLVRMKES